MDYPKTGFWIALSVGGLLVGAMSFAQQAATKEANESFRLRAVFRDVCIGAFLTAIIYMFLPESIETWTSSVIGGLTKTVESGGSQTASGPIGDIELQIGPARF